MRDFLAFRNMIVPSLVQYLYVVGTVFSIVGGIAMWFSANSSLARLQGDFNGTQINIALILIFVVPFVWRVVCESIIVFFRINETLTEIKNLMEKNARVGN